MILPEYSCHFVLPHPIANQPHSLSAELAQTCKQFLSGGKFLVIESGKFLSLYIHGTPGTSRHSHRKTRSPHVVYVLLTYLITAGIA